MCVDRKEQILWKEEQSRLKQEEERMFAHLWNKDFLAKSAKEEEQVIKVAEKNR